MVRTPLHGDGRRSDDGHVRRWQTWTTLALLALTIVVAPGTLLLEGGDAAPYEEYPTVAGLAVATLVVAVPLLAGGLATARHGSNAGYVAWLGALGFSTYVWTAYALIVPSTELLVVHVALFALSVFTFAGALTGAPADSIATALERRLSRTAVTVVVAAWAALLALAWLVPLGAVVARGDPLTPLLRETAVPEILVVLELGVLAPVAAVVAAWLSWRRQWGYVAVGVLLVALSCLGVAVLASVATAYVAGSQVPVLPTVVAAVLTAAAIGAGAFVVGALGGGNDSGWDRLGRS